MTELDDAVALGRREQFLAVVSTVRGDGSVQASVVNAGVVAHPVTGERVVGFVTYGRTKLRNLRARPRIAITFRSGWSWSTIEGNVELVGPDDPHQEMDDERLRTLLRDVFVAAGGAHDDWSEYDRVMVEQRRTAVLTTPDRIYSN